MTAKVHKWREVGRVPVTLVHHACDCGCGRRRMTILSPDGRGVAIGLPPLGRHVTAEHMATLRKAITVGEELAHLWKRAKALAGA